MSDLPLRLQGLFQIIEESPQQYKSLGSFTTTFSPSMSPNTRHISSFWVVSDSGNLFSGLIYTQTPRNLVTTLENVWLWQWDLVEGFFRSNTVMYLQLTMWRKILSTMRFKGGCGFLRYLHTLAKAVTKRNSPFGYLEIIMSSSLLLLFPGYMEGWKHPVPLTELTVPCYVNI